jgi:hypothetical protein
MAKPFLNLGDIGVKPVMVKYCTLSGQAESLHE